MAITTYSELQAAVPEWLDRSDTTTIARIPDFISLAEARMMRKLRLRLMEVETTVTLASGSRTISLPADYREPMNLWLIWASGRQALNFIPPELMETLTASGPPQYWTIDGATLAFQRPADQSYTLTFRYIQKLALSDDYPSNSLLAAYPDAYLTATLAEAARYLKDPDMAKLWDDKHNQISHDIREEEERQKVLATLHTEPGLLTYGRRRFDILRGF